MAKQKLNLQTYQQDILARLKMVAEGGQTVAISRLGVSIAGRNHLVALADVSEVLSMPDITKIPLTKPWFMGVANVRGNLAAVSDLASFLGEVPSPVSSESRVLLAHTRFGINAGLLVDRLIGLRDVQAMQLKRSANSEKPWQLNVYQDDNGQEWQEIDIGLLISEKEFLQVAI